MRKSLKYIKILFFGILILIAAYFLFSVILSLIPVNKNFRESINSNYNIWIKSNGVHLDIVLPVNNNLMDWNDILSIPDNIKNNVHYAGFGWGDKNFYINTPEWSDLKLSTGFRALFVRTDAAMHVSYYNTLSENDMSIKLLVSEQQFNKVQLYIRKSFKISENKAVLIEDIQYGSLDRFYEANYSYSLLYTCNSWTNEAFKKSGLPACVWTPFDKGILYHYRNYNRKQEDKRNPSINYTFANKLNSK